jgi:hypothetical protein
MTWMESNLKDRLNDKSLDLKVFFNIPSFKAMSLYDASSATLKQIADKYQKLYLSFSGGYDSEYVLRVCLDNKIPIQPIIVKIKGNETESGWAEQYCKANNVTPIIQPLTEKEFVILWYERLYKTIHGRGYNWAPALKSIQIAEQNNGFLVTGDCPPTSDDHIELTDMPMANKVHFAEWDFYTKDLFNHPGGMLGYSVECMYGFLNELDTNLSTQQAKSKLYGLKFREKIHPTHSSTTLGILRHMCMRTNSKYEIELGTHQSFLAYLNKFVDKSL